MILFLITVFVAACFLIYAVLKMTTCCLKVLLAVIDVILWIIFILLLFLII